MPSVWAFAWLCTCAAWEVFGWLGPFRGQMSVRFVRGITVLQREGNAWLCFVRRTGDDGLVVVIVVVRLRVRKGGFVLWRGWS